MAKKDVRRCTDAIRSCGNSQKQRGIGGRNTIDETKVLSFWTTFERLCYIQCTQQEIQDILGLDEDTLQRLCKQRYSKSFPEIQKIGQAMGKSSLRRVMWKKALADEHVGMQIWLSKQHLGMKEKTEETFNGQPFIIQGFNGESVSLGITSGSEQGRESGVSEQNDIESGKSSDNS